MPYVSDAQRKYMHAVHPKIAKKWDKEFPNQKGLPEHVEDKKEKSAEFAELLGKMAADTEHFAVSPRLEKFLQTLQQHQHEHAIRSVLLDKKTKHNVHQINDPSKIMDKNFINWQMQHNAMKDSIKAYELGKMAADLNIPRRRLGN